MLYAMRTFFFYDLETSGLNGREDRIMQFAGQRTDENLAPLGDPYNILIALTDDTLPSPSALLVTGITPQKTIEEGYSEMEFAKLFLEEIATPGTVIVGYNNIRFDDEFIRALLWRTFNDPYEWAYGHDRSRWDLLDVVRMTRALRPEGIEWPLVNGVATNKLELLSQANKIQHENAHDALSDVNALIEIAKLLKDKQPKLFSYLLEMRAKKNIEKLVSLKNPEPFVYASGRYDSKYHKTTVAYPLSSAPNGNIYVYDLRADPEAWTGLSEEELTRIATTPYSERGDDYIPLPVKKLQYNRAPAVAPLGVLESEDGWNRIGLNNKMVRDNIKKLESSVDFGERVSRVLDARSSFPASEFAESQLYDGFISEKDKTILNNLKHIKKSDFVRTASDLKDERLISMVPRFVVQNMPSEAVSEIKSDYEKYRLKRLKSQSSRFLSEMKRLSTDSNLDENRRFILQELQLWYENVMPDENF